MISNSIYSKSHSIFICHDLQSIHYGDCDVECFMDDSNNQFLQLLFCVCVCVIFDDFKHIVWSLCLFFPYNFHSVIERR